MKDVLLALVDRLEKQNALLLQLSDRLDALEGSYDDYVSHAVDDRLKRVQDAKKSSESVRLEAESRHKDIRRLIAEAGK